MRGNSINNQFKYYSISNDKFLNLFLCLTFLAAVLQDLFMVIGGHYLNLGFGFHQNFLNNPLIYLYPLKIFKYIFFLIALYLCLIKIDFYRLKKNILLFLLIAMPSIIIDIINDEYLLVILGFKSILAIGAYYIGLYLNPVRFIGLYKLIKITILINSAIAYFQVISIYKFMVNNQANFVEYFGVRAGGTFLEPNTLGLYGLICIIFMITGVKKKIINLSIFYMGLAFALIIFSGSRTAFLAGILTILLNLKYVLTVKNKILIILGFFSVLILMLYGRGFDSVFIRANDFYSLLTQGQLSKLFFGNGFGIGTISAGTYSHIDHNFFKPISNTDSQWIAYFVQGGYWVLGLLVMLFLRLMKSSSLNVRVILLNFLILGFGIQFVEAWPFGFLAFMLIGFCNKQDMRFRYK